PVVLAALLVDHLVVVAQLHRAGGAGFFAIAAEDAAQHVDLIAHRVAFAGRDAVVGVVFGGLDPDRLGGAGGGAQRAADALFQAVFVAVEDVPPAKPPWAWLLLFRIGHRDRFVAKGRAQRVLERAAHAF